MVRETGTRLQIFRQGLLRVDEGATDQARIRFPQERVGFHSILRAGKGSNLNVASAFLPDTNSVAGSFFGEALQIAADTAKKLNTPRQAQGASDTICLASHERQ